MKKVPKTKIYLCQCETMFIKLPRNQITILDGCKKCPLEYFPSCPLRVYEMKFLPGVCPDCGKKQITKKRRK